MTSLVSMARLSAGVVVAVVPVALAILFGIGVWRSNALQRPNLSRSISVAGVVSIKADVWQQTASTHARAPLIIYMPGWGGARDNNLSLLHALSLRGYCVVAVDDIAHDAPYTDPADEAARTAPFNISSDEATRSFIPAADRRVVLQAKKVSGLLDGLARDPELASRIDFARAGILGGSFGGATATLLTRQDLRLKAAVNLDGWQFGPGADDLIERPYLVINSVQSRFTHQELASSDPLTQHSAELNKQEQVRQMKQAAAREDTYRYLLTGGVHSDLTDTLHSVRRLARSWFAWGIGAPMPDAVATRAGLDDVIGTFFDRHVSGEAARTVRIAARDHGVFADLGPGGLP